MRLQALPGEIQLSIRDEGRGFDIRDAMKTHGLGLLSMQERVSLAKGRMAINSAPHRGTEIIVRIPVADPRAKTASTNG
ncbi:MAG: hypothetical protein C5B56_09155 [Proteobacteria bacterium]|nr:MAG: hypothetical protein C5B56_09155 [Pseudomonadota bacterium]